VCDQHDAAAQPVAYRDPGHHRDDPVRLRDDRGHAAASRPVCHRVGPVLGLAGHYAILPIGLPVIWVRNRDADPGVEPGDQLLPRWLGRSFGVVGIVICAFALALFAVPGTVGRLWPWSLTPLMAQVVAGWLMFFGAGAAMFIVERRFQAVRAFLPSVAVWFGVLGVAALFHLDDFNRGPVSTGAYFVTVTVVVAVSLGVLFYGRRLPAFAR
jgi:hypothetical protein